MAAGARIPVASSSSLEDSSDELLVPRFVATLRTIAASSSVVATLTGVLVLTGWSLDVEPLRRFFPGLTATIPTTAIGFICSGCALGLVATQSSLRLARGLAVALAAATAILGGARVLAIGGLYDAGIDRMLVDNELLTVGAGASNQMAPNYGRQFPPARRGADDHRPPAAPLPLAGTAARGERGDDVAARADGLRLRPALASTASARPDRDGAADRA